MCVLSTDSVYSVNVGIVYTAEGDTFAHNQSNTIGFLLTVLRHTAASSYMYVQHLMLLMFFTCDNITVREVVYTTVVKHLVVYSLSAVTPTQ